MDVDGAKWDATGSTSCMLCILTSLRSGFSSTRPCSLAALNELCLKAPSGRRERHANASFSALSYASQNAFVIPSLVSASVRLRLQGRHDILVPLISLPFTHYTHHRRRSLAPCQVHLVSHICVRPAPLLPPCPLCVLLREL